jgi:hypothetical protein
MTTRVLQHGLDPSVRRRYLLGTAKSTAADGLAIRGLAKFAPPGMPSEGLHRVSRARFAVVDAHST